MKRKILKKAFVSHSIQTVCLLAFLYLTHCFIQFSFYNPFAWILDIPNYTNERREEIFLSFFFGGGFYSVISLLIWYKYYDEKLSK